MSAEEDRVTVIDHPLIQVRLTKLRDESTPLAEFRSKLQEIAQLMTFEVTRDFEVRAVEVETPITATSGVEPARPIILVPILRAGLGFLRPAQDLLPDADIGFIGIARNEETHEPEPYVNKLPDNIGSRPVIVVDPMLATGGSLIHTLRLLVERGAPQPLTVVVALAAPEGIAALEATGIDVTLFTAVVDDHLNDDAYIVPGLGDAGDRQFGAPA